MQKHIHLRRFSRNNGLPMCPWPKKNKQECQHACKSIEQRGVRVQREFMYESFSKMLALQNFEKNQIFRL